MAMASVRCARVVRAGIHGTGLPLCRSRPEPRGAGQRCRASANHNNHVLDGRSGRASKKSSRASAAMADVGSGQRESQEVEGYAYQNGFARSQEAEEARRDKISSANSGRSPWNVGLPHKLETRRKIRQSLRDTYAENPELANLIRTRQTGRKHSEATRRKIRAARMQHVKRQKINRERRNLVNSIWSQVLCIQERRVALYESRKAERDAKKLLKKKRKSLGRGRGRGRKNGDRIASGAATSSSLSAAEGRSKPKSEEHRRRISEAMKRKWKTKAFRESAARRSPATGKRRRPAPSDEISSRDDEVSVVQTSPADPIENGEDRSSVLMEQEELRRRARELLAAAHRAAASLREIDSDELEEGGGQGLEIREALRSLEDADALVSRLHGGSAK